MGIFHGDFTGFNHEEGFFMGFNYNLTIENCGLIGSRLGFND